MKPILIREKFTTEDEHLLNTFKRINELNMNKQADFSLSRNGITLKTETEELTDLLETAMILPRTDVIFNLIHLIFNTLNSL